MGDTVGATGFGQTRLENTAHTLQDFAVNDVFSVYKRFEKLLARFEPHNGQDMVSDFSDKTV